MHSLMPVVGTRADFHRDSPAARDGEDSSGSESPQTGFIRPQGANQILMQGEGQSGTSNFTLRLLSVALHVIMHDDLSTLK